MKRAFTSDLSSVHLLFWDTEKQLLPQIDEILHVLKNGKWHDLKEIFEKTELQELNVELLTHFLAKYDFIELDEREHKTRLAPPFFDFLKKIRNIEEKEGLTAR